MSTTRARPRQAAATTGGRSTHRSPAGTIWALTRVSLGLGYLWTFFDRTFGLGISTPAERAWLTGNSPTRWSLLDLNGPVASWAHPAVGNPAVDLVLMLVLVALGLGLVLGVGMWPTGVVGALLMALSVLVHWPELPVLVTTPLVLVLLGLGLAAARAGDVWGLGLWWSRTALVRRLPWLR